MIHVENQEILNKILQRLDSMDAGFDSMDKRFDGIDIRLDSMDKKFDAVDARLGSMDTRISTSIDNQETFQKEVKNEFSELKENQQKQFNILNDKISLLTKQANGAVNTLSDKIDIANERLDKNTVNKFELEFLSEKVHSIEKQLYVLKQQ